MAIDWKYWNPGLVNGEKTLGEELQTLPGAAPDAISLLVRLIENPLSPFAFPGAITLQRHDAVHVLLGRGLLAQDEAFVIGFTMGCSKKMKPFHEFFFRQVAHHFYPKNYRFNADHLLVYKIGLREGKNSICEKIHEFPFEEYHDWKIKDLRAKLGIDVERLKEVYKAEKALLPKSKASSRL